MDVSQIPDEATGILKDLYQRVGTNDDGSLDEIRAIIAAKAAVLSRYQQVFASENLSGLTEDEFRGFLYFRNNHHWIALQRMGPAICSDMDRLRNALRILLKEDRPIRDRLNDLMPSGASYVPRLGKAVLTPILLIVYPDRYGVWNQVSEAALKVLHVWPQFEPSTSFGDRYELVNGTLVQLAAAVGVDLWILDALLWRAADLVDASLHDDVGNVAVLPLPADESRARFGLERHLHEFLRDNWAHTELGSEWKLYEEDGDPEAGYEYPCDVGRIDLLAKHRTEPRWLIVELKRSQSSDQTVGQVLRYMGWIKQHLAAEAETVEGLIISHDADDPIRYALVIAANVRLKLYEVEFRLRDVPR